MANRDISQNMLGHTKATFSGSGGQLSDANQNIFKSVDSMKTYLHANGYVASQTNIMTKNDLIKACRTKLGGAVNYK